LIARAVRRMHAAGLAHSDLSYKNILIDPVMAVLV
jgi:tRNA A-37 threonylcarbamoyl transferase component Bud32